VVAVAEEPYPGRRLGLPAAGRGSLASWTSRILALAIDWAVCMAIAVAVFGTEVMTGNGWRSWMILATFFTESTLVSWFSGSSIGQLICRIGIVRLDRQPLGLPRAILRAALICLVLPALVVGADRRGLHDLAAGTVVVRRG
jgi:uncharacterized RDD family membrane protein YckC